MNTTEGFRQRTHELMLLTKSLGDELYHKDMGLVCRLALPPENKHRRGYDVAQSSPWYCNALAFLLSRGEGDDEERHRLNRIIGRIVDHQVTDPNDPGYGNYRWYPHWETVEDKNGVSFIVPEIGQVLAHHQDLLDDDVQGRLADSLRLAVEGLERHPAPWRYTNIFVLNILSRLTIAAALDDSSQVATAVERWDEWFRETDQTGILEYNSPAYSAVALGPLGRMLLFAPNEELRQQVLKVLDSAYQDLVLHWHGPTWQLTGAQSRASHLDRLGFSLVRQLMYQQVGGPPIPFGHAATGFVALNPYEMSEEQKAMALDDNPQRLVKGYFPANGIRRTCLLAGRFSMSSRSGPTYGRQEAIIHAALPVEGQPGIFFKQEVDTSQTQYAVQDGLRLLAVWPVESVPEFGGSPHVWIRGYLGHLENVLSANVNGKQWQSSQPLKVENDSLLNIELKDTEGQELSLEFQPRFVSTDDEPPAAAAYFWHDPAADQLHLDFIAHGPCTMGLFLQIVEGSTEAGPASIVVEDSSWSVPEAGLAVDLAKPPAAEDGFLLSSSDWKWRPGDWSK